MFKTKQTSNVERQYYREKQSKSFFSGCLLLCSLFFVSGFSQAASLRTHDYHIAINPELTRAVVKICFDGQAPAYLVAGSRKATKNILQFPSADKGFIEFQGGYWKTKALAKDSCIRYHADISEHKQQKRSRRHRPELLNFMSENTWLWLPEKLKDDETVEIEFDLKPNYRVSAPWTLLDHKGYKYRLGRAPHEWGFTLVIGDFKLQTVTLDSGAQLNIALLNPLKQKGNLKNWLVNTADALSEYLGFFPRQQLQIVLIENRRFGDAPVPWGDVKRGGGTAIRFVVNSSQPIAKFYQDWTATHEFSHLLLPSLEYRDCWLSEGLSSYLQYLLMVESNQLSEVQAWQGLYDGFNRGLKGTQNAPSEKLMDTAINRKKGERSGRTKRLYWSGAVYFLKADLQLRKATQGQMNLAQVLSQLNKCCVSEEKEWSGLALARQLDELSATQIFSKLYREMSYSNKFPEFKPMLKALGIAVKNDKVYLQKQSAFAMRGQIMKSNSALLSQANND